MIIKLSLSRSCTRLLATAAALAMALGLPLAVSADAGPSATWVALAPLPEKLDGPVFALAVDPANPLTVLAGTSTGRLYRSPDGGGSWTPVKRDLGRGIASLAFNPFKPGQVLAGTRGAGIWKSVDAGATWAQQPGTDRYSARSFGFGRSLVAAGTDHGILTSRQDGAWAAAGLDQVSVSALALAAVNDPARLLAGGDATRGSEALPLYQSADGAASWLLVPGPNSASNMVAALAAGALPPKLDIRPVVLGTNSAAFVSIDNGASWQQMTGAGTLPNTDFNQVAFAPGRTDRFYLGSDGGGSDRGGLWTTFDSGQHFTSLNPPVTSVTALAVAADGDAFSLYVATFRPRDQAVFLWRLRDTGQPVSGPAVAPPTPAPAQTESVPSPKRDQELIVALLMGPEGPFLALGLAAMAVLTLALVAYIRRGRG